MVTRRGFVSSTAATGIALAALSSASAQSASAVADGVIADLQITIRLGEEEGVYDYDVENVEQEGYVSWVNDTDVDHNLTITQDGTVTTKVQLNPGGTLHKKFHQAGPVHFECTTHDESGLLD